MVSLSVIVLASFCSKLPALLKCATAAATCSQSLPLSVFSFLQTSFPLTGGKSKLFKYIFLQFTVNIPIPGQSALVG